jgi:hypothetical protein
MPTIYTQTDDCCDIIGRLNQEFLQVSDEITALKNKLRIAEEDEAREYWDSLRFQANDSIEMNFLQSPTMPTLVARMCYYQLSPREPRITHQCVTYVRNSQLYETMEDSIPNYWLDNFKDRDLKDGVTSGGDFSGNMYDDFLWAKAAAVDEAVLIIQRHFRGRRARAQEERTAQEERAVQELAAQEESLTRVQSDWLYWENKINKRKENKPSWWSKW